jgi:hypothetical protein
MKIPTRAVGEESSDLPDFRMLKKAKAFFDGFEALVREMSF